MSFELLTKGTADSNVDNSTKFESETFIWDTYVNGTSRPTEYLPALRLVELWNVQIN